MIMSTGEKPLNPAVTSHFTMPLPGARTPTPRQALFDWLKKLRLAMRRIKDASRMAGRSRYSSEPKVPSLNVKKRFRQSSREFTIIGCSDRYDAVRFFSEYEFLAI